MSLEYIQVFWNLFSVLLPFIILAVLARAILYLAETLIERIKEKRNLKKREEWKDEQEFLNNLRALSPSDFESFVGKLFEKMGYKMTLLGGSGDHGVDVELMKDGTTSYVQCKRYKDSHKVGEPEIRNFLGALDHKRANSKGYFVTTGYFTLEAELFAKDKPIELIDGGKLLEYVRVVKAETA